MPAAVRALAHGLMVAFSLCGPAGCRRAAAQAVAPARLALVVGEAAYPQARLPTAAADAGLVATSLMQAGFDVTAVADADAALLRKTIPDFVAKVGAAGPGIVVAVYLSGYGLEYDGENWLVPVGARIDRADEVPDVAIRLAEFTAPLETKPASTRLFLFDLARRTPFGLQGAPLSNGLALTEAPVGSIYAYNTAPGAVARPDVPPYGAYARSLAEAMQGPGLTLGEVLRRTRLRVGERTDGAAVPFDDGSADPGFAFHPGPPTLPASLAGIAGQASSEAYSTAIARDTLPGYVAFVAAFPRDPLVGRVRAMAAARRESLFWSEAVRANTPRAYWTYMRRYPRGPHFGDVRRQLFALHAALEPPPRFDIVAFEGLPPPPPDELAALDHPVITFADADGPSIPPPPEALLPPARSAFFDKAPPPPLGPAGALPLPLPVAMPDGQGHPPGRIAQPAAPGGALVTTLSGGTGGFVMTSARADGAIVSRVSAADGGNSRTISELSATGAMISKVTIATASDGATTITQLGPGDRPLGRSVSRNAADGGRATTLFDAGGQPVATTSVSAAGIVTANALVPGRAPPPRFVMAITSEPAPPVKPGATADAMPEAKAAAKPGIRIGAEPDANPEAKAGPVVVTESEAMPRALAPSTPAPVSEASASHAPPPRASAQEDETKTVAAVPAELDADRPPAMPAAAGLTGRAPALDLPPPPQVPAFDAAAAPVAPTPTSSTEATPPSETKTPTPAKPPPAVVAAPSAVTPPAAGPSVAKPPASTALPAPGNSLDPATSAASPEQTPAAAQLPKDPPLPPPRARFIEPQGKRGARR